MVVLDIKGCLFLNLKIKILMITNKNFILATLSLPTPDLNRSGFKSAVASTFKTVNFSCKAEIVLNNMNNLNLKNWILITVSSSVENTNERYARMTLKIFNGYNCKIKHIIMNNERFFSIDTLNYFFEFNKEKSYEYIFLFEGLS